MAASRLPMDLPRPRARLGVTSWLTRGASLTPPAILAAARQDVGSRQFNRGRRSGCLRYVFLRQHVRAATSAADLIRRAIAGLYDAGVTTKRETKLIYSDARLLRDALELAADDESTQAEEANNGRA